MPLVTEARELAALKESPTLPERFQAKVCPAPPSSCWLWMGSTCEQGYGRIGAGSGPDLLAHRVAYTLRHGPIPDGHEIDHLCRTPECVNPDHLEVVTRQENCRRAGAAKPPQSEFVCGHPFEDSNKYYLSSGAPYCRRCHLDRCKRYRQGAS